MTARSGQSLVFLDNVEYLFDAKRQVFTPTDGRGAELTTVQARAAEMHVSLHEAVALKGGLYWHHGDEDVLRRVSNAAEVIDSAALDRVAAPDNVWIPKGTQFRTLLREERLLEEARSATKTAWREDDIDR